MIENEIHCTVDGVDKTLGFERLQEARIWAVVYARKNPHIRKVVLWRPWVDGIDGRETLSVLEQSP